jgi:hypothetical protein
MASTSCYVPPPQSAESFSVMIAPCFLFLKYSILQLVIRNKGLPNILHNLVMFGRYKILPKCPNLATNCVLPGNGIGISELVGLACRKVSTQKQL